MPVGTIGKDFTAHKFAPQYRPFGRARGAKPSALTRKRQQELVLTIWTPNARKAILENSTIQIFFNDTGNDGPPGSAVFFKAQIVFAHKTVEMMKQHGVKRSFFGVSLPINFLLLLSALLWHERQEVSRIAPSMQRESLPSRKGAAMKIRLGRSNSVLIIPAEKTTINVVLYGRQLHLTHTLPKKESKRGITQSKECSARAS